MSRVTAFADWTFRDRTAGKIVIAQFPNVALIVWLSATALTMVTAGGVHTFLGYATTVALVVWAAGELFRGVNPFRRLLGVGVLAWEFLSVIGGG